MNKIKRFFKTYIQKIFGIDRIQENLDAVIMSNWLYRYNNFRNNSIHPIMPEKYFSQGDEDGYTLKILSKIQPPMKTFCEIGVGNGMENNTLILLASGLKGIWIGNEKLEKGLSYKNSKNFSFINKEVSDANVEVIISSGLKSMSLQQIDYFSVDIDSFDYKILKEVLVKFSPKVLVCEINGKLGSDSQWSYQEMYGKSNGSNDYFGMSFSVACNLLRENDYIPLTMNLATGLNLFAIRKDQKVFFPEIMDDLSGVYVPPSYLIPRNHLGKKSTFLINSLLNGGELHDR